MNPAAFCIRCRFSCTPVAVAELVDRLVLVRMERPKRKPGTKVRIIRRKGKHSLLSIGRPISREEIFKALEQFPP